MGRPRKSLHELKLSGTYQQNKKRYESRLAGPTPATLKPLGRAPSYLTKEEKSCWKEISGSGADVVLSFGDRLALEVVCKLLARSRTEVLKPTQLSSLAKQLAQLQSKGQNAVREVVVQTDRDPLAAQWEEFCAEEDAYQTGQEQVRAESQRRREIGPQGNQTHQEWDRWCWYSTIQKELENQ